MATGNGSVNLAFVGSSDTSNVSIPGEFRSNLDAKKKETSAEVSPEQPVDPKDDAKDGKSRDKWGSDIEFLMSCIALSVGLGNVWRFPFTALANGGGAFVIPYIIVLFLVGKPVYYMEMLLGQFSSRGSVKVFDFAPIIRGVGYGQVFGTGVVATYYATIMAITLRYFISSFYAVLPWSYCREQWGDTCIDSKMTPSDEPVGEGSNTKTTSAELYFINIILREKPSIDDGIGYPNWTLAICLAFAWIVIAMIMIKGIKSSGKASYFLALFPYAIMIILLIRALTLPGAFDGVIYFLKPQWDKLLDPRVWYAAVTQVFFSLTVCFGNIITYASYNRFNQNIKRDVTIVTTLDTFTSLLSGVVIFGILGNLAYESNTTDIQSVIQGDAGLAFISYPDAIAKFQFVPQIFSVIFFLMLFVLGIGSNVGMASCVMTVLKDQFTNTKHWIIIASIAVVCYSIGLIYLTPGGQYMLVFVDFHGATFVALVLAIFELLGVGWIYGVKRLCKDTQFMLGIKTSFYYRICWGVITPAFMAAILIYTLVDYKPVTYKDYTFQDGVYILGWCISAFGIGQLIIWGTHEVRKQPAGPLCGRILNTFKPYPDWGPADPTTLKEYKHFMDESNVQAMFKKNGFWYKIYDNIFG